MTIYLRLFALILLLTVCGPARAQTAPAATVTPTEANQTLQILQDDAKRAQLIQTLQTIARTAPAPAAAAAAPASAAPAAAPAPRGLPLAPDSLGVQLVTEGSVWVRDLSHDLAATTRAVTSFPLLWHWMVLTAHDPEARHEILDTGWKLLLILACALAAEQLLIRLLRRPLRVLRPPEAAGPAPAIAAAAPLDHRHQQLQRTWQLLRLLPWVAAALVIEILPVAVFALVGNLLLGTAMGDEQTPRLIILAVVNAYALCRTIMCVTRMLVAPSSPPMRLVPVSDETAAYIEVWIRRLAITAIAGGTLAEIALLLGLYKSADEALLKAVALLIHLFGVVIVLQCRQGVAAWLRADAGNHGSFAVLRNHVARIWHLVAIFLIVGLWIIWAVQIENGFTRLIHFMVVTVLVIVASRVVSIAAFGTLDRLFQLTPETAVRFPGLEARANRYYPLLRHLLAAFMVLVTLVALLEVWGLDAIAWFERGAIGGRLVSAVTTIVIAILMAIVLWEVANAGMDHQLARLNRQDKLVQAARLRTLEPMIRSLLLIVVATVVGLTILGEIGVNIGPLLAGASIIGVALGFGSQKLVQDLINGLFLLLENAMQVGDNITVAGLSGTVEDLSIRTIRLRAGDGSVHIIPFSAVTSVTNINRGIGNASVTVSVAFDEDTDRVATALTEIGAELQADPQFGPLILSPLSLWGVDKVDGALVTLAGQIPCTDGGRWGVQREFNRRLKIRFQELGIQIANSNTQTVLLRRQPDRAAPAKESDTRSGLSASQAPALDQTPPPTPAPASSPG